MSFDAKAWVNELTNNPAMFPVVPDYRGESALITAVHAIYNAGLAAGRTEGRDEGLRRAGEIVEECCESCDTQGCGKQAHVERRRVLAAIERVRTGTR